MDFPEDPGWSLDFQLVWDYRLSCLLTLSMLQSSVTAAWWWLWMERMVWLWFDQTVECEKAWLCPAVGFLNNNYSRALCHLSSAYITKSLTFTQSHTCSHSLTAAVQRSCQTMLLGPILLFFSSPLQSSLISVNTLLSLSMYHCTLFKTLV